MLSYGVLKKTSGITTHHFQVWKCLRNIFSDKVTPTTLCIFTCWQKMQPLSLGYKVNMYTYIRVIMLQYYVCVFFFFFLIHHADTSVISIISFARVIVSHLSPKLHFWNMSEELHLSSLFSLCLLQIIFILKTWIKGRPFFIADPWKLVAGMRLFLSTVFW